MCAPDWPQPGVTSGAISRYSYLKADLYPRTPVLVLGGQAGNLLPAGARERTAAVPLSMDAGTPALPGGAAAGPPPKKCRVDAAGSAEQPPAHPAQNERPAAEPAAAAAAAAAPASAGAPASASCAKATKNQKKRKTFIFGNYDAYYSYRGAAPADPAQSGDPRLQLLQRSWFEGRSVLDIGCNSGVITFAMAEKFAPRSILGVDIDGHLISRAQGRLARLRQAAVMTAGAAAAVAGAASADAASAAAAAAATSPTGFPYNIEFRAENFVARKHRRKQGKAAAKAAAAAADNGAVASASRGGGDGGGPVVYDVILCLSVTKWIHLNWGDAVSHPLSLSSSLSSGPLLEASSSLSFSQLHRLFGFWSLR